MVTNDLRGIKKKHVSDMSLHFQLELNTLGFLVSPWIKSTGLRSDKHEGQVSGPALSTFMVGIIRYIPRGSAKKCWSPILH